MGRWTSCLLLVAAALVGSAGCETFDPAPRFSLLGEEQSKLTRSPEEPLVLVFAERLQPGTLKVKLLELGPRSVDPEGRLPDEPGYTGRSTMEELVIASFDASAPDAATGGTFSLEPLALSFRPAEPFAYSQSYLLLVEPGVKDLEGNATRVRQRFPFSYPLQGGGPTRLPSGYYFFLINVEFAAQQLKLFTYLEIDPTTGIWDAIFTDGNRDPVTNSRPGCPVCPEDFPVCQLLSSTLDRCVKPSDKITLLEHFGDLVPIPTLPKGYVFRTQGFARDEANGSVAFGTPPFDIDIYIGSGVPIRVTTQNTQINATFTEQEYAGERRFVATGNIAVANVQLNGVGENSPTTGDLRAMTLTRAEVDAVESFGLPIPRLDYEVPPPPGG